MLNGKKIGLFDVSTYPVASDYTLKFGTFLILHCDVKKKCCGASFGLFQAYTLIQMKKIQMRRIAMDHLKC